ncbi:MAG: M2 family metallopeptidase [Elusimicrobiota bacterium]
MFKTSFILCVCLASPSSAATLQEEAAQFVRDYSSLYQSVYTVSGNADWDAATDVSPEHDGARIAANKALASVTGNPLVIEQCKRFLAQKKKLDPLLVRQLERMLLSAAENPGTLPDVTAKRVELEARQSSAMDSFQFCLEKKDGVCVKPVTANDIDDSLVKETDLAKRRAVWEASKEIGPVLKPGLVELQGLRNSVAAHFGYPSYFDLQTANMSMSADELVALMDQLLKDIQPLYEQLHCYAKYELAERYKQPVPEKAIPAHWIANRWAQEWCGLAEGVDLDPYFKGKAPEWLVQQGEGFWTSLGFPRLPESFWKKSDLYALPKDSKRKKNTHASAWHVDLDQDVRSLQNVESNVYWWNTVHHELGHVYYYVNYTTPTVPVLLRTGATRAFHEGVAEFGGLSSSREAYLRRVGLLPADKKLDREQWLLNQAFVETVAFLPWAAGTVTAWERDVYAKKLPASEWNARWWEYVRKYQGIEPPAPRGEEYCDACTKTHVNDNPAYYYNYAVATILKYQLYAHICRNILKQDMQSCDPYGKPEVGEFLKKVLSAGATKDWRALLKETTGQELSTQPMMEYFQPLVGLLEKENKGRQCGWQ